MDKLIVQLLQNLDCCSVDDYPSLNNEIAQKVMGWHLVDNDLYRIWRLPSGEMVKVCSYVRIHGLVVLTWITTSPSILFSITTSLLLIGDNSCIKDKLAFILIEIQN